MKTIFLMRHGRDDERFLGGWSDVALTLEGRKEIQQKADIMADLSLKAIFSSDLRRARETAEIVAVRCGLEVELLSAFRETNNGDLAGLSVTEFHQQYPGLYWRSLSFNQSYPNGESPQSFFERIKTAWQIFRETAPDKSLLVTHGGVISAILCIENHIPFTNKTVVFPTVHAEVVRIDIKDN